MGDARLLLDTLRLAPWSDADALASAWATIDASNVVALAQFEGVSLWLHRRLKSLGITLSGEAGEALAAAAKRALAYSLRMESETLATLAILDEVGITAIPLKGAAMRRIAARVPYANARAPNDVDVLVQDEHAQRAWDALVARGYAAPKGNGPTDGHHLLALAGPLGVGVEIHLTTSASVAPAEAWRRATSDATVADFNGVSRVIPSDTELFWHAIAHAVIHAEEYGRVGTKLRFWLDPAALLAADASIDWARIRARLESRECADPALVRAWIRTAAELSGRELPAGALGDHDGAPIDLERMIAWRLRVFGRYRADDRWAERLIEEGARGELSLLLEPAYRNARVLARMRHAVAAGAARLWWTVQRGTRTR
jgi:hypothetical protein